MWFTNWSSFISADVFVLLDLNKFSAFEVFLPVCEAVNPTTRVISDDVLPDLVIHKNQKTPWNATEPVETMNWPHS